MFAAGLAACFMLSGCDAEDQEKVENSWNKAEAAHTIAEAIGKTAIEAGVVDEETALKLKAANSAVKTVGGAVKETYTVVKESEKKQVVNTVSVEQKTNE